MQGHTKPRFATSLICLGICRLCARLIDDFLQSTAPTCTLGIRMIDALEYMHVVCTFLVSKSHSFGVFDCPKRISLEVSKGTSKPPFVRYS